MTAFRLTTGGKIWIPPVRASLPVFFAGVLSALPTGTPHASGPLPENLDFQVYRSGDPIGHHRVKFRRDGEDLHVEIDIALDVKLAFITLYSYRHQNREIWRDGRLLSLETRTDDNGKPYQVTARRTAEGLLVAGAEGSFVAPADTLPTSYWNPATVDQTKLLDTQHGRLVAVDVNVVGGEPGPIDDRLVPAQKYAMTGDLNLDLWYGPTGEWRKITFTARGAEVEYLQLSQPPSHKTTFTHRE